MSENNTDNATGIVLEIQRLSTEDGPGIRSTVFMKGCSLHCQWCHNPESIDPKPQLQWISSRCIGCKTCLSVCQNSALFFEPYGIEINRANCQGCGDCAKQCPTNALELMGKKWKANDLVKEVLKDRVFFEKSGGGVTISGGESTLQYPFVAQVMKQLKEHGVHTALDTCGLTSLTAIDALLPFTDLVLYDLKEMDPESHKLHTGSSNERILAVLQHICEVIRQTGQPKEVWIRTPIIPQTTYYPDNVAEIGRYIEKNLSDVVTRWDLLAFNNLCRDKYTRLGLEWTYSDADLISEAQQNVLLDTAEKSLSNKEIINWNGNTQLSISEEETSPEIPFPLANGAC